MTTPLAGLLEKHLGSRAAGGIGVATPDGRIESAWIPAGGEEPRFLAYSITKTFTATLLLLLQEEGRLALDDPLARWFPRIQAAERIPLRRLLDNTAGIPDYGGRPVYHESVRSSPSMPWSFERFVAETVDRGLLFEPGAGWSYSNVAYMLLKRIAEETSGEAYGALITDRIARPLGLERTFVPESVADLATLAPALSRQLSVDRSPRDVREHYHPGWVSHGVVASTPSEIVRFFDALFRGRLLSPPSREEMTTLVSVPLDHVEGEPAPRWRKPSYGLGLMADPEAQYGPVFGHNGGGPGYSTSAFHAPRLGGISVCAMISLEEDPDAEQIVFDLLDRLAP